MAPDGVVGLGVRGFPLGADRRSTSRAEGLDHVAERLAQGRRRARPEGRVEECADIRIGDRLRVEEDAPDLPGVDVGGIRRVGLRDQSGGDAEVVLQLGLEVDRHALRIGQGRSCRHRVVDGGLEALRIAGRGERFPPKRRIEAVPRRACAAERDVTRGVVRGHLGARREPCVDDLSSVDAEGQRPADGLVVERGAGRSEAEVDHVQPLPWPEREADIAVHGLEPGRTEVVDAVDRPGLQLRHPSDRIGLPADDHPFVGGASAGVAVVPRKAHFFAAIPALELVRSGPVDLADDGLLARPTRLDVARDPARVVDPEGR